MIKKNKWKLILSSIVILLPIAAGLLLWDQLPEQMATHWGINGDADGWGSRAFAVFAPPVFILILHWICVFVTAADPKNKNQTDKAAGLIFLIFPFVSILAGGILYCAAFGMTFRIEAIMPPVIGLLLAVIGNYLPKCKQNRTLGVRVKWTLENEENWNATHRFCGKVWFIGGLLLMVCIFLPGPAIPYVLVVSLLVFAGIPVIYSYVYHRRQLKDKKEQ